MHKSLHLIMKLAASFGLLAILFMPAKVSAQYYENFDNLTLGSTPEDGSYNGNGITWYYQNCRGDVEINESKAITLGADGVYSDLRCYEITGRIQYLSFDYMQTGPSPATIDVVVNGDYSICNIV